MSNSTGNVTFYTSGSNIGFGKANPAYSLDVVGHVNLSGGIYNGGTQYISFSNVSSGSGQNYPPASLTAATTTLSGQTYGNGTYVVSASGGIGGDGGGNVLSQGPSATFNNAWWKFLSGYGPTYNGSTSTVTSSGTFNGEWLQLQLPSAITVGSHWINQNGATNNVVLAGSTNGSTWTTIFNGSVTTGASITSSPASYSYYRWIWLTGNSLNALYINSPRLTTVSGTTSTVAINGTISKTAGSFDIAHVIPEKAALGYRLRHCFVESPTCGDNVYRFKVNATSDNYTEAIKLDDYWCHLNENPQVWVSRKDGFGHGYGSVDEEKSTLTVTCEFQGLYDVLLIGTRKDKDAINFFADGVEYLSIKDESINAPTKPISIID